MTTSTKPSGEPLEVMAQETYDRAADVAAMPLDEKVEVDIALARLQAAHDLGRDAADKTWVASLVVNSKLSGMVDELWDRARALRTEGVALGVEEVPTTAVGSTVQELEEAKAELKIVRSALEDAKEKLRWSNGPWA